MVRFGEPPQRCYSLDEKTFKDVEVLQRKKKSRKQARYKIVCPGCRKAITFGKALRTRWIRQQQTRVCRHCRTALPPWLAMNSKLEGR